MMTLQQFSSKPESIPTTTSWYLADLGEARGKQELFTKQSPQRLKVLREHALTESAVSSNRIEGVVVDQARIATVIFGKSLLRDRDEEEVRGYRDALKLIHEQGTKLPPYQRRRRRDCIDRPEVRSGMLENTKIRIATLLRNILTVESGCALRPSRQQRPRRTCGDWSRLGTIAFVSAGSIPLLPWQLLT